VTQPLSPEEFVSEEEPRISAQKARDFIYSLRLPSLKWPTSSGGKQIVDNCRVTTPFALAFLL
jgi:hypothetical protein